MLYKINTESPFNNFFILPEGFNFFPITAVFLFYFLFSGSIASQPLDVTIEAEKYSGEFIEETGQKEGNVINGTAGGSRITYPRSFYSFAAGINLHYNQFEYRLKLKSSLRNTKTGTGRDEDFYLNQYSTIHGAKIVPGEGKFYDTAYTFTGTKNFADAKGTMKMTESAAQIDLRYYFSEDPLLNGGFFVQGGYHYSYLFYIFEDAVQFLESPVDKSVNFYYIPGKALTFSLNLHEYVLGAGYRLQMEKWSIETSFLPLLTLSEARDRHILRFMNFYINTAGAGFILSAKANYNITDTFFTGIEYTAHRNFQAGSITARGGLSQNDILSNYLGPGKIYLNTKEASVAISATKRFL